MRHVLTLTLRERLQAVEDMAEVAERLKEMRERDGAVFPARGDEPRDQ